MSISYLYHVIGIISSSDTENSNRYSWVSRRSICGGGVKSRSSPPISLSVAEDLVSQDHNYEWVDNRVRKFF